ncbi:MAG: cyclic lactone autoinducer peptide [Lachnospiraceae bacterium]|nr:cyclic lactone autoinducer peptide [Lachnospiraceae bacterium]
MIKKFLQKYGSSAMALALITVATQVAAHGCYYIAYQPEEPAALKKLFKNK